jgi:PAS domain S-box-containing protein
MGQPMEQPEINLRSELEARLRFETVLADISSKFINLPAGRVDREIEDAQHRVCACLGLDMSALWQWTVSAPRYLTITHLYRSLGGPALPERIDAEQLFPWCLRQVLAGKVVSFSSLEALPPQAAADREVFRHYGARSTVAFPLSAGGEQLMGVASFHTMRQERLWPEETVVRLQLVAQVFANALARQRADEALRQSEERFRNIALNLPAIVYQFYARDNGQRGLYYLDGQIREMCGLSAEPLETFFERFAAHVDAEDRQKWMASVETCVRQVQPWESEFRFTKPTGEDCYLRAHSRPRRAQAEVVFSGVIQDVTQLKRSEGERQRHRQELAHLNRVSALGELAGSLAHELNQPLTAILSNAQAASRFLAHQPVDLDEVRDILQDIADEGRRAGEIIRRMRNMLKKDQARCERLDLNEIIPTVLGIMRSDLIVRNVAFSTHLTPGLARVRGDGVQLTQVLLNLVSNACDAMSARPVSQRRLAIATAQPASDLVEVSVTDQGNGIPPEKLEQVFEPFFSTKPQGIGMGLPICRSIIAAHGGRLWAENHPGGGARFRFTLPLAAQEESAVVNDQ